MLKYINYQLLQDDQLQQQLETQLASELKQRLQHNITAFRHYQPALLPWLQRVSQRYSVFCTCAAQLNIADYASGRVLYTAEPEQESSIEAHSFLQQAPFIRLQQQVNTISLEAESLPVSVDAIMVFGLGLGHHIVELLRNARIKYLIIYEPEPDFLLCSVQAIDWAEIFELAAALGTMISFQLGNSGTSVAEDLAELQLLAPHMQKVYLYRHIAHGVSDEVFEFLLAHSGKPDVLFKKGYQFLGFEQAQDFIPERPQNILANQHWQHYPTAEQKQRFTNNMVAFKQLYPDVFDGFVDYQPRNWQLVNNDSGQVNLLHLRRYSGFYQDIEQESVVITEQFRHQPAKDNILVNQNVRWKFRHYVHYKAVSKLKSVLNGLENQQQELPQQADSVIIFGIALGRHIELLLQRHCIKNLYLCEPNSDFFYASLYTTDWVDILTSAEQNGRRIYLNIGGTGQEYFADFAEQFYHSGAYAIADTYMMSSYYSPSLTQAIRTLRSQLRVILALGEYFDHVRYGIAHTYHSLQQQHAFLKMQPAGVLNPAQDMPVFIIGNGPSLDDCIPYIQEYRDKVIVISCGTALRSLYKLGIQPDIHAEVEQNRSTFDWITQVPDKTYLKGIKLLSVNGIHPDTAALFEDVYLVFKEGESSSVLFQSGMQYFGINTAELAYAYPTVSNLVVNFVLKTGFRQIYLFGVDLGYLDSMHHHSKHSSYYKEDGKELYDYRKAHGEGIPVAGNFQQVAFTKPEFDVSRRLIEQAIMAHPQSSVYNCSNGARIAGAVPLLPDNILLPAQSTGSVIQLKQFLDSCFIKDYPASLADDIIQRYDFSLIQQSVAQWCALLTDNIGSYDAAKEIISQQWLLLRNSVQQKGNITMLLFNGSTMYFLSILTKLLPVNNTEEELQRFNQVLNIWREYLQEAAEEFITEPFKFDSTSVAL